MEGGHERVTSYLLRNGADIHFKNKVGVFYVSVFRTSGHASLILNTQLLCTVISFPVLKIYFFILIDLSKLDLCYVSVEW